MSVARRFYIRIMAHHLKRDASHSGERFVARRNKKFSLIPVPKSPSHQKKPLKSASRTRSPFLASLRIADDPGVDRNWPRQCGVTFAKVTQACCVVDEIAVALA